VQAGKLTNRYRLPGRNSDGKRRSACYDLQQSTRFDVLSSEAKASARTSDAWNVSNEFKRFAQPFQVVAGCLVRYQAITII